MNLLETFASQLETTPEEGVVGATKKELGDLEKKVKQELPYASLNDALAALNALPSTETKAEKKNLSETMREHLHAKEYGKALMIMLQMVFFGDKTLKFDSFHGEKFPKVTREALEASYTKDPSEKTNPDIVDLKNKIATTSDVNQKLSLGFLLTQRQDFFQEKEIQKTSPNAQCDDMALLAPRLQVGSIICMRQDRQAPDLTTKAGDAGLILNDNNTIADFTHTAIITSLTPEPIITHSTMKNGVSPQPLKEYLANFPYTNVVVMNPNDAVLGADVAAECVKKHGMQYDKKAPVAQFISDVAVQEKYKIQDDPNKTNCVEFIADALYAKDNSYTEIADKSHPNDMLSITKHAYSLSYVKTYTRDKAVTTAPVVPTTATQQGI